MITSSKEIWEVFFYETEKDFESRSGAVLQPG